jgi:hypothetical protein
MYYQSEWWALYRAAVLETNPREVGKRVTAARNAIEKRLLAGQLSHQETSLSTMRNWLSKRLPRSVVGIRSANS